MRWWHHFHDYFLPHERNGFRPHLFGVTSVAALAVVILILELGFIAQVKLVFPNTEFLASVLPGVLATLTNDARIAADVPTVTRSPKLDEAALLAAQDMAAKGYFAHVSPDGTTPWDWLNEVGYQYSFAGENLAVNFSDSNALQSAWMDSPTHRANIVKQEYTQVGFGTALGMYEGKQTTFVVEFFATPLATSTAPNAPAPVQVATKAETAKSSATTTGAILAAETPPLPAVTPPAAGGVTSAQAPVTAPPTASNAAPADWLALALTSPLTTVELLFALLFALFAMLAVLASVRHWRLPHAHVVVGGALLLALSFGLLAMNPLLSGRVQVPQVSTSTASVVSAMP